MRKHPVMVRRAALRLTSTRRVCALLHHTGARYSAGAYTSSSVDVFNAGVLVPARRRISAVRVMTLHRSAVILLQSKVDMCSLAGKSPTADVHIELSFCISVVQVKRF